MRKNNGFGVLSLMNIFDILGPVMIGPSSSHTAGAARMGYMARRLLGEEPARVHIGMYGSFAATGKGHGTDKAIVGGILGMKPDDLDIPASFEIAEKRGVQIKIEQINLRDAHPNTAVITAEGISGRSVKIQASSLGGGRIVINKLDDIEVNCSCEIPTLIIHNQDTPGYVADVTLRLLEHDVNIANMSLYRRKRGGVAVMVIEVDQPIPMETVKWLESRKGIIKVTYIDIGEN